MKTSWKGLGKKSWRCLEDFFAGHLEDVFKTSWRRLEDVWPRRIYWSWPRRLEDVFWRRKAKANIFVLIKTSWRRLLKTKTKDVFKTSSRRLHQDECLLGCFLFHFESSFCSQGIKFLVFTFWSCIETAW